MPPVLPSNPFEAFPVENETQKAIETAGIFGWWDFPLDELGYDGTDFNEEVAAYWYYTSAHPVRRTKREVSDAIFKNDPSVVELPKSFASKQSLTLGVAGDLIQTEGLEHSANLLFEGVEDILFNKDVVIGNYESVVVDQEVAEQYAVDGNSYLFCCSETQYRTLTEHKGRRFDILNLANNHSLDFGGEALSRTQDVIERDGITHIGAPRKIEDYGKAKIYTRNGIRLGLISVTYSVNEMPFPEGEEFRVHLAQLMARNEAPDLSLLRAQIQDCRDKGCDFIIASIHWGVEFEFFPRLRQVEAAHAVIEEGVDLILGHHPHVIQPVEYYRSKRDPNRVAVIAYSLGSLSWGWYTAPHLILSLVMNFGLVKGSMGGETKTYIENAKAIPVYRNILNNGDRRLMRIEKLFGNVEPAACDSECIGTMREYFKLTMGGGSVV